MNDFTKEELSLLWRSLNYMIDIKYFIKPTTKELLKKLQSLIDYYCEHEHKDYRVGDSRPMVMTHECLKCGKEYK